MSDPSPPSRPDSDEVEVGVPATEDIPDQDGFFDFYRREILPKAPVVPDRTYRVVGSPVV